MNLIAGLGFAVLGLIMIALGATGVVPGLTQTGIVPVLAGLLIIGLSFVKRPDAEGVERMPTGATLGNIFVAPSEVFQNLRRHPRWIAALLIMTVLSAIFTTLFMQRLGPDRVANYAIDKTLQMSMLNDEARKQIEAGRADAVAQAKNPIIRAGQAVSGFASSIFGYAFLALVFFLVALAMGGTINYWQAFSAAVYAAFPVSVIRYVLSTIILFLKDPTDIHPITGQTSLLQDNLSFLFAPAQNPVLYSVAGMLGLLSFYWIWMNATGLKNTGENVSSSAGWTASLTIYFVLILLVATMTFLFPSFVS